MSDQVIGQPGVQSPALAEPTQHVRYRWIVGLTLAKEITARTSLSVVVLERGQPRRLSDYAAGMDELDYALRYRMMQTWPRKPPPTGTP